jgi:hypothetical protein
LGESRRLPFDGGRHHSMALVVPIAAWACIETAQAGQGTKSDKLRRYEIHGPLKLKAQRMEHRKMSTPPAGWQYRTIPTQKAQKCFKLWHDATKLFDIKDRFAAFKHAQM